MVPAVMPVMLTVAVTVSEVVMQKTVHFVMRCYVLPVSTSIAEQMQNVFPVLPQLQSSEIHVPVMREYIKQVLLAVIVRLSARYPLHWTHITAQSVKAVTTSSKEPTYVLTTVHRGTLPAVKPAREATKDIPSGSL